MTLAIINGLMTSILLERLFWRARCVSLAFKTAIGMSLISMIAMEAAMNITDVVLTGRDTDMVGDTVYALAGLLRHYPIITGG